VPDCASGQCWPTTADSIQEDLQVEGKIANLGERERGGEGEREIWREGEREKGREGEQERGSEGARVRVRE
jgi:hypothetical protein